MVLVLNLELKIHMKHSLCGSRARLAGIALLACIFTTLGYGAVGAPSSPTPV